MIDRYDTRDSEDNHSDHMPLQIVLNDFVAQLGLNLADAHLNSDNSDSADKVKSASAKTSNLRWDHGNTQAYYENTGNLLYPIYNSLLSKYSIMLKERDSTNVSVPSNAYNDYIETVYESIVSVLHNSAKMFIPRLRQTTLKPWWSDILNKLKAKALDSHILWEACGRPRSGLIFDVRNRDKLNYKAEIRRAKRSTESSISNELYENLCHKDSTAFWKTWNSKVNTNIIKFSAFFQEACTPNSSEFNQMKLNELNTKLENYTGDFMSLTDNVALNAEFIALAVCKLESGKAQVTTA